MNNSHAFSPAVAGPEPDARPLSLVPASSELPLRLIGLIAAASATAGVLAASLAWPLWSVGLVTLGPWLPLYFRDVAVVYRDNAWLAGFYVVAVSQAGHLVEHVAQMVQIHVLHLEPVRSRGIFGPLDIEWVHFGWNTWVFLATGLLLVRYRRNAWLWAALAIGAWHQVEHTFMILTYVRTGVPGSPGLLASGGAIGGGLPLKRPDLHFLYNIAETAPLLIAFAVETARARRAALRDRDSG